MLKIESNPKFTATVRVNTAAIKGEFQVTYLAKPTDELDALDNGEPRAWREVLKAVVVDSDPVEINGTPVRADTPAGLADLVRWPGVGPAMLAAYWQGLWGEAQGN